MKMDHHCYWIGNCIGLNNIKFFFQYGIYVALANTSITWTYFSYLYDVWQILSWTEHKPLILGFVVFFFTSYNFLMLSIATMCFHIIRGNTLIEARYMPRQGLAFNPYNLGIYRNFMHTFGESQCLLGWLLPLPKVEYKDKYWTTQHGDRLGVTYFPLDLEIIGSRVNDLIRLNQI